jgi:hypothetical protein
LDIVDILSELRQERDRLEQAIRRLEALSNKKAGTRRRGHRVMSAAARAKIAAAARRRWAAVRKAKRGTPPKAS